MADFEALQEHAKVRGYRLTKGKKGLFVGDYRGIQFEDEDPQRLADDMDAVAEIGESEEFQLLDEADEKGESIVQVTIDGEERQFINISVAAALAEAKEALLAAKPKPRGRARRVTEEPEPEESQPAKAAPPATEASKAWEREEKAQAAKAAQGEILPPEGSGVELNALKIDLRAFQAAVRELAEAAANLRKLIDAAVEDQPAEEEEKPRGRGRPRRNGR